MSVTRRSFLSTTPLALLPAVWPGDIQVAPSSTGAISPTYPTQAAEMAMEMVGASHNNLARVKELLAIHPTLARASWDWGFGDWEDALGAASHVGNREIAAVLLANGARPSIFSAAMLGQLEVVKAFIAAAPGIESTPGPHGITLLSHAMAGGAPSQAVAEYLKTLPGANKRPDTQLITPEQAKSLTGDYVFGAGPTEKVAIAINSNNILTFARAGRTARNLTHVGDMAFYPSGAPLVRVRFAAVSGSAMQLTVHDPGIVLTATRTPTLDAL
jgi:hypothetical protein